jgi:hypothetical protein
MDFENTKHDKFAREFELRDSQENMPRFTRQDAELPKA